MPWNGQNKKRKYAEVYYVNRGTGTAHVLIGCALSGGRTNGAVNVDKVGSEDAEVEIDNYCNSCCYEKDDDPDATPIGDK